MSSVVSPRGRLSLWQGWLSSVTFFESHGDSLGPIPSAITGEGNVVSMQHGLGLWMNAQD